MLVAVGFSTGVVVRIVLWLSPFGQYDGDEAVWGLIAAHAFDGKLSAFFWGQGYGGVLEALLTGVLFELTGSSWLVLRLVPIALTLVAALLVWRVGRRTIGEPAARVSAVVFWVFPAYLVWKSIRAHGFYASGLVLAVLILLLVLRLAERRSRRDAALLGLCVGVAWWQTTQIVTIALPALAWLTWQRREVWRDAGVGVPAALVGAMPWIVSNLQHDWWSLDLDSPAPPYATRLQGGLSATLPMALGLRLPFTSEWIGGTLVTGAAYVCVLGVGLVSAWRLRRRNISLLAVVAAVYLPLYAASDYTWLNDEPRYLVLLMPVLTLLLCTGATSIRRGALVLAFATVLTVVAFVRLDVNAYRATADGQFVPREFAPLVHVLDRLEIRRVFAPYWIAYRLTFETSGRIVAADADTGQPDELRPGAILPGLPYEVRWPPYLDQVASVDAPAWVVPAGAAPDREWRRLFEAAGYERFSVGGFAIYHRGDASAGL